MVVINLSGLALFLSEGTCRQQAGNKTSSNIPNKWRYYILLRVHDIRGLFLWILDLMGLLIDQFQLGMCLIYFVLPLVMKFQDFTVAKSSADNDPVLRRDLGIDAFEADVMRPQRHYFPALKNINQLGNGYREIFTHCLPGRTRSAIFLATRHDSNMHPVIASDFQYLFG